MCDQPDGFAEESRNEAPPLPDAVEEGNVRNQDQELWGV